MPPCNTRPTCNAGKHKLQPSIKWEKWKCRKYLYFTTFSEHFYVNRSIETPWLPSEINSCRRKRRRKYSTMICLLNLSQSINQYQHTSRIVFLPGQWVGGPTKDYINTWCLCILHTPYCILHTGFWIVAVVWSVDLDLQFERISTFCRRPVQEF